ncbi:DUF6020 family protein [Jatrophihabitans sp.]|jgi:hypothetical protein|uniref:DUF6020 family protein n=1 Tax=Jatrophihabitans sp. TaxID=1932789 RepID=UPI002EEA5765
MTSPRVLDRLRVKPGWALPIAVFGWAQLVLLGWWAGQWPGLLSADSVRYIIHVTGGTWTADHSVLYDSAVLASLNLTGNVALLTFVQTTVAAACIAYMVVALRAVGVPGRWGALAGCLLPLLPSFGAFISTVWKDVPFALCEVLITATTLQLIAHRKASTGYRQVPRRLLVALGLELLGLTLFRNDGFLLVLVIAVVLALAWKGLRLVPLGLGAVAILISFGAQAFVYPAMGVKPANSSLSYGLFDADIALAYAQEPDTFTPSDLALLSKVAPLAAWKGADNCYNSDGLFRSKGFSLVRADQYHKQLFALWWRVLERSPVTVVKGRLCRGSVAWSVMPPPSDKALLGRVVTRVPSNLYSNSSRQIPADIRQNLATQPLSDKLGRAAHKVRVETGKLRYQWWMWRGATWCYIAYLVLLVAALRLRRWDLLTAGVASLANQLTVLAANPAQLYRYMVGPIFVGFLLLPLLAAAVRRPAVAAGSPAGPGQEPTGLAKDPAAKDSATQEPTAKDPAAQEPTAKEPAKEPTAQVPEASGATRAVEPDADSTSPVPPVRSKK